MSALVITRAGPLATIQDAGRAGMLRHGISASGPMDRAAFERAADWIGGAAPAGIEFTAAGLDCRVEGGGLGVGLDGGSFTLTRNGEPVPWPARLHLADGDMLSITPGPAGNYGYLRFARAMLLDPVLGSWSTNSVAALGPFGAGTLKAGDRLSFGAAIERSAVPFHPRATPAGEGPIRVLWGLHADLFAPAVRQRFASAPFIVSPRIDRMGARLEDRGGVFSGAPALSLVSDAIVPGDIQILGDGTPIVLLRDHQPTGGYPRIASVITADLDRFVQMRPGSEVRFEPVTLDNAHAALKSRAS